MAHTHPVVDSDSRFVINSTTRAISTTSDKLELIQGDHQSERITFEIPKIVEGHDMSLCDRIEVHYINIDRRTKAISKDIYIADDMAVDGDKLTFSWLISGNATKYYGRLNFIILFECLDSDGNYTYKWNTEICKLLTIGEGISNTEAVAEDYSDILEKFKNEILGEAAEGTVKFTEQTLTDEEKKQARTNIGAQEEICSENEEILLSLDIDHNFAGGLNKYTRQLSDDEVHIYDVIINGSTQVLLRSNKLEYTLTPGGFSSGYGYLDYNGEHIAYRYSLSTHTADRIYFYPDTEISKNLGDSFTLSNYNLTKIPAKYLPMASIDTAGIAKADDFSSFNTSDTIVCGVNSDGYLSVPELEVKDMSQANMLIGKDRVNTSLISPSSVFGQVGGSIKCIIAESLAINDGFSSKISVPSGMVAPVVFFLGVPDRGHFGFFAICSNGNMFDGVLFPSITNPTFYATLVSNNIPADQTNALAALAELGLITPAQQNGTFYTSPAGEIYTI